MLGRGGVPELHPEWDSMRSPFQVAVLSSLQGVLLPIVKLMLRCGVGCSEFVAVVKTVFVQAATEDYGLRGRPTNVSRVAAMTGLSRKEVRRIRSEKGSQRWTRDMEVTPANTVLHYWHFDPDFAEVSRFTSTWTKRPSSRWETFAA